MREPETRTVIMTADQFDTYRHWLATQHLGAAEISPGSRRYNALPLPDIKRPCTAPHCDAYTSMGCSRCMRTLCRLHGAVNTTTREHSNGGGTCINPQEFADALAH